MEENSGYLDPKDGTRICLVYQTDSNKDNQRRLLWSFKSLLKQSKLVFDVAVLSDRPTIKIDELVPSFQARGKYINVLDMDSVMAGIGIAGDSWNRGWPYPSIYRLGIPLHPLFSGYDRIFYLDTDTLVRSSRVDAFIQADLSGFEVGGVPDVVQEEKDRICTLLFNDIAGVYADRVISFIGDSLLTRPYINSGVLILNNKELRKDVEWYRDRLVMLAEAYRKGQCHFLDQDFLNVATKVKSDFSLSYNWFNMCGRTSDSAVIRHYCGRQYQEMERDAVRMGIK